MVYDRPIGNGGLRWSELQAWWKDREGLDSDDEAKKTLYNRLKNILPKNSPPQLNLYNAYHEIYSDKVPDLPALLPEVWLHWDAKTYAQRGLDAMLRMRMDFLLLLPDRQRVVLDVDGVQHYSRNGKPDTSRYAENVRGDRDLKLSGYEVFRFGGIELQDPDQARGVLQPFFAELFRRFNVTVAP